MLPVARGGGRRSVRSFGFIPDSLASGLTENYLLAAHRAAGHIERAEQSDCAVAHAIVGDALDVANTHRQHGLGALERLALALLVNEPNQWMNGRA